MRAVYLILLIFLIGGCTQKQIRKEAQQSNYRPRSDALVVGVGNYKNRIRPLDGVKKDLVNIKRVLKHFRVTKIKTLQDSQATLKGVREAFYNYIRSNKNRRGNIFIFYYSGHGVQVVDRSGDEEDGLDEATALYDIDLDNKNFITKGVLLDDELLYLLSQIKSKKILIFDKCHSGSSHRGDKRFVKSIIGKYKLSPNLLNDINRHIRGEGKLRDFVIFSATKDDQEAEDSPIGGLFTNSFINGILYRKADINRDNRITVAELEKFCTVDISHLAVNLSKKYIGTELKGEFTPYFAPREARDWSIKSIFNLKPSLNSPKKQRETVSKLSTEQKQIILAHKLKSLLKNKNMGSISIKSKKQVYSEGEYLTFEVDTIDKTGYLYMFALEKDKTIIIYPNPNSPLSEFNGKYRFPEDFGNLKIQMVKNCKGCEQETSVIYALLTKKPIPLNQVYSKAIVIIDEVKNRDSDISIAKMEFIVK